jgi:hypothetical protein
VPGPERARTNNPELAFPEGDLGANCKPTAEGEAMIQRRAKRTLTAATTLVGLMLLVPSSSMGETLDLSLCAPDRNSFTLDIDNEFLPLAPVGRSWVLRGEDEGRTVGLRITVLNATETFTFDRRTSVMTRVVEELEWVDTNVNGVFDDGNPSLIEVSLNYFAQTDARTVCYFGEDVDIYEDGRVVSNDGSWRADRLPGLAPGIFMPAAPKSGMHFQQEVAPGVAEDEAKIVGTGAVATPFKTFDDTIRVREANPIDGDKGYKAYARRVGLIVDGPLSLISFTG